MGRNGILRAAMILMLATPLPAGGQAVREFRTFGGSGLDVGNSIRPVGDGYVVVGYTDGPSGSQRDAWLLRLDARGDTLWTRRFGGPRDDHAWDVQVTPGGTFLLAGFQQTGRGDDDVWVLHVDADGALLWERTFGGPLDERAWALALMRGGDAVVLAQTESFGRGAEDAYLIRIGISGDTVWTRHVGEPGSDRAFSIVGFGEGALFAGMSEVDGQGTDVLLGSVSAEGAITVDVRPGGPGDELGHGVVALPDGGYLVTGYAASRPDAPSDILYLWLDESAREIERTLVERVGEERAMMTAASDAGRTGTVGYALRDGDWEITLGQGTPRQPSETTWTHRSPGPGRGITVCPTPTGDWILAGTVATETDPGQLMVMVVPGG